MTDGANPRARELLRTLRAQGFQRDRADTESIRYAGKLCAANRDVSVAITFPDLEFTRLPELALLNPEQEASHVVAHLSASGAFCFARNEDIVLDRYDVGGTALLCLELARQGLERALTHQSLEEDIAREFPQHWLGTPFYYDTIPNKSGPAKVYTVPRSNRSSCVVLADRSCVVGNLVTNDSERGTIVDAGLPAYTVWSENALTFCTSHRQPNNLAEFLDWLESCAPKLRDHVTAELCRLFPKQLLALFVCADNGCVGITVKRSGTLFKAIKRRQALLRITRQSPAELAIDRWSGTPIDLDHVMARNMHTNVPLTGRRIALIGCGAIGSHLAKLLVQSGAGHANGTLLLIDNQLLEPANVGRHYLGMNRIGDYKSEAMQQELERLFPKADIRASRADATHKIDSITKYDLVIDATGEEALSVSINQRLIGRGSKGQITPALYVRLFGNGAAAQTLTVDNEKYACFKCLRPNTGQDWRYNPMKSDAKITTTVANCGEGQYVAYGVSAPSIAAALALQAILDWNSGTTAPRMRTLRVDKASTKKLVDKNVRRSKHCPACGADSK